MVLGDKRALTHRAFVEGLDIAGSEFDPAEIRDRWQACRASTEPWQWSFDARVLERFETGEKPR